MECEAVRSLLAERLSGPLTGEESAAVARHLETCPACRAEAGGLAGMWHMLGAIDAPPPDSERLRARFDAILDRFEEGRDGAPARGVRTQVASLWSSRWTGYLSRAAAAVVLVAAGIGIGYRMPQKAAPPTSSTEIASLRGELHDLREMVTLSLMQQQSASERLKGVSWSGRIEGPSGEVVTALLDALMHDPNVNVRLATIDALERFSGDTNVRQGALQAVDRQASPLVQIALIDFMVKTNERESVATLRRLADDPQVNEAVRARAALGLQQLG